MLRYPYDFIFGQNIILIMEGKNKMESNSNIKIHELPSIQSTNVDPSDLLVIETSSDTYSIKIEEIRVLLNSDEKVNAIYNQLSVIISEMNSAISETVHLLKESIDINKSSIQSVIEYVEQVKHQISDIQILIKSINEITDNHKSLLESIQDIQTEHSNMIVENSANIEDATELINITIEDIGTLKEVTNSTNSTVVDIENTLSKFISNTNLIVDNLKKMDIDNLDISKKYSEDLYSDCMKYIDYFHHVHSEPPNFDEPWHWEEKISGYAHPVHTLYHTTDSNWDPKFYKIPGVWELKGYVNLSEDDQTVEYIYERVK